MFSGVLFPRVNLMSRYDLSNHSNRVVLLVLEMRLFNGTVLENIDEVPEIEQSHHMDEDNVLPLGESSMYMTYLLKIES